MLTANAHHSRVTTIIGTLMALTIVGPPAVARAQAPAVQPSTRATVLLEARQAEAQLVMAPKRSSLEQWLYWFDNQYVLTKILAGWKGIHIAGGDFPAGAGIKFGVGFDKGLTSSDGDPTLRNRLDLTARAAYSTRGYSRARAGLAARNLGGLPIDVEGFGQVYEFPQEDFFGFGRDSVKTDRTNYLLDAVEAGGAVHWRPTLLEFGAAASYFSPRIGHGTDSRFPSTEQRYTAAAVPGLGSETDFLTAEASAAFNWQDNPLLPRSGGRYAVTVAHFDDRDLRVFDFRRIDISLQQYVPLPNRYRRVALRGEAVLTRADVGQSVPFYLQPTLGGSSALRGFQEFRFRDQNVLLLGAEYQWETWWAMDTAFFVDAGTVAARRRELSVGNMDVSYGVGLRFHSNSELVGRLDLAFSREGFVPLLRFDRAF